MWRAAPLSANIEPQVQTVDYGRPATLTCHAEGNPIKSLDWTKDGAPLNHADAVLRIDAVRREDKGMYQCFVRNDQESAQASAELKLGGRCQSFVLFLFLLMEPLNHDEFHIFRFESNGSNFSLDLT